MSGTAPVTVSEIRTIGDLPFHERPVLELLGLTEDRTTIDLDYAGYGWARVDRVWLADAGALRAIDDALVIAVHSADDGPALADDVELEFALDGDAAEPAVTALASAFLERWLPRLPRAAAIVLAMCNPHHARLRPPRAVGTTPLFHGLGDVDSWLDETAAGPQLRLHAAAGWRRSTEASP